MSAFRASLLMLGVAPAAAAVRGTADRQGFLSTREGMRPEVVALSLGKVEDEWKNQYHLYVECNQSASSEAEARRCLDAPKAFERSCSKIVTAMVEASGGNRENVHEYMADVCSEPRLQGWRQGRCEILAATVLASMSPDSYSNREALNTQPLCVSFWSRFSAEEEEQMKLERTQVEARQKKEQEEREAEEKRMAEQEAQQDAEQKRIQAEEAEKEAQAQAEEKRKEEAEKAEAEAAAAKLTLKQHEEAATSEPPTTASPPQTISVAASSAAASAPASANATAQAPAQIPAPNATAHQSDLAVAAVADNTTVPNATAAAANGTAK